MYTPIAYFLTPGEIAGLRTDARTRTPTPLIRFTVGVHQPENTETNRHYIVLELGDNNEEGAHAILTPEQYDDLYCALNPNDETRYASKTVLGETVSANNPSASPMRNTLAYILTTKKELTVSLDTRSTPDSTGVDLTMSNYPDDGGSVTLSPAQCGYFHDNVDFYVNSDSMFSGDFQNKIVNNPSVVNASGDSKEVSSSQTFEQAAADLLDVDSLSELQ